MSLLSLFDPMLRSKTYRCIDSIEMESGCYDEPLLDRAELSCDSSLFCQLSKTKCGYKPSSKGLSYFRLRDLVLDAF